MKEALRVLYEAWYQDDIALMARQELGIELSADQRRLMEYLSDLRNRKVIVSAGRGAGKTLCGAILAVWSVTALAERLNHPYRVVVLGGVERQAQKLYSYCLGFLARSDYLASRLLGDPMRSLTKMKDGSCIYVFPASEGAVRGEHADCLIFDEVAVARDELVRASFSIVDESAHPRTVLLSTPHDPMSIFVGIWQDADKWGFTKFNWDASRCLWKDKEEIALKEANLSRDEFTVEYKGLPASSQNAVFDLADIRECRVDTKPHPVAGSPVIMGLDWGFTPPLHITVATLMQKQGDNFVVLESKPCMGGPGEIQERIKALYYEFKVERVYADMSHISENQRLMEQGLQVTQVPFQNQKNEMVYRAQRLFQQRKIKLLDEDLELIKQLTSYQWTESKTGKLTPAKGRDDYVDSFLLALQGAKTYQTPSVIKIGRYH